MFAVPYSRTMMREKRTLFPGWNRDDSRFRNDDNDINYGAVHVREREEGGTFVRGEYSRGWGNGAGEERERAEVDPRFPSAVS